MTEHTELSNLELDEVSLVTRGANQFSKVMIWKSEQSRAAMSCTVDHNGLEKGERCPECGAVGRNHPKRKVKKISDFGF